MIDDSFGFKLVEATECDNTAASNTNPDCLRTAAQVKSKFFTVDASCSDGDYAAENPDKCGPVRGESCFRGSPAATAALSLAVLVLSVLGVFLSLW